MSLNHRENWLRLMRREGFDFVPPQFILCPDLITVFQRETESEEDYQNFFDFSTRLIGFAASLDQNINWLQYYDTDLKPETTFSTWGVAHEPGDEASKHMMRMYHPMEKFDSIEQFQAYPYPDFSNIDITSLKCNADKIKADGYLPEAHMAFTIWEQSWYLRGMENLMIDMMTGAATADYLFDKVTEAAVHKITVYAEAGAEHIHIGDDIGMQQAPMMSLEMYRDWLKPRLKKVIEAAKRVNPDVLISYHSCGYVQPFIPDLIDAGIDILNPIQTESVSFEDIHREYGQVLSFWGTIGTQTVMPYASPDDVKLEVRKNLDIAGVKGGLWCTPTHILEPEIPWENILEYVEACNEYRVH
jgi:uroporphyrinogen decarboxylase